MLGPLVTVRCPDCRGLLSAHAPALPYPSWVSCPHCGRPVPVVPPQDPPPLFSWEAYPQLYASPDRGRRLGPAIRRAGTVMLVAITLFLAAGATTLLAQGALATSDHPYDVGGVVEGNSTRGAPAPLSRAWVNVTGENGFEAETISGAGGGFRVDGVPAGGISVSVAASGYAPVTLELFADPVFSSPAGNLTGLAVDLEPGGPSSATTFVETPYPSLESLLTVLVSGTAILFIAAAVAGAGAVLLARRERYPWAVAGGFAGGLAPLALFELGIDGIFPVLAQVYDFLALLGLTAAFLATLVLAVTRAQERPGS